MPAPARRHSKWYGWRPSLPDFRDYQASDDTMQVTAPARLPAAFSLLDTGCVPPVKDQGALGSCVSNTVAALAEFDAAKQGLVPVTPLSRLFVYWNGRAAEQDGADVDSGLEVRTGIKVLNKLGAPSESVWPYTIGQFAVKPNAASYRDAKHHCGRRYLRVRQDVTALKRALIRGWPVSNGFSVYESFESAAVEATGLVPLPARTEALLGGHCTYFTGWDDAIALPGGLTGGFWARNHWSASWGKAGDFCLPYAYVENPDLCGDLWVIKQVADTTVKAAA